MGSAIDPFTLGNVACHGLEFHEIGFDELHRVGLFEDTAIGLIGALQAFPCLRDGSDEHAFVGVCRVQRTREIIASQVDGIEPHRGNCLLLGGHYLLPP